MNDTFDTIRTLREMEQLEEGAVLDGVKNVAKGVGKAAGKVGQIGLNMLDAGVNASKNFADSQAAKNPQAQQQQAQKKEQKSSGDKVGSLKQALQKLKGTVDPETAKLIDQVTAELDGSTGGSQQDDGDQQDKEQQAAVQEIRLLSDKLSPKVLYLQQNGQSQFTKEDVPILEKFVAGVKKSVGA